MLGLNSQSLNSGDASSPLELHNPSSGVPCSSSLKEHLVRTPIAIVPQTLFRLTTLSIAILASPSRATQIMFIHLSPTLPSSSELDNPSVGSTPQYCSLPRANVTKTKETNLRCLFLYTKWLNLKSLLIKWHYHLTVPYPGQNGDQVFILLRSYPLSRSVEYPLMPFWQGHGTIRLVDRRGSATVWNLNVSALPGLCSSLSSMAHLPPVIHNPLHKWWSN